MIHTHEILIFFFCLFFIVDTKWPEEAYGGISTGNKLRAAMDRASLPTAPRASRGPDIDVTKVPDDPPYTAFLGNLSYDVDRDDIFEFFAGKKVWSVQVYTAICYLAISVYRNDVIELFGNIKTQFFLSKKT